MVLELLREHICRNHPVPHLVDAVAAQHDELVFLRIAIVSADVRYADDELLVEIQITSVFISAKQIL